MPHDWLRRREPYYEEVEVDYRAKDPLLRALKKRIRLRPDKIQCREVQKVLPGCLGWGCFMEAWKPGDLILTSRQKVRSRVQRLLFNATKRISQTPPFLCYTAPKTLGGKTSWSRSRARRARPAGALPERCRRCALEICPRSP